MKIEMRYLEEMEHNPNGMEVYFTERMIENGVFVCKTLNKNDNGETYTDIDVRVIDKDKELYYFLLYRGTGLKLAEIQFYGIIRDIIKLFEESSDMEEFFDIVDVLQGETFKNLPDTFYKFLYNTQFVTEPFDKIQLLENVSGT